jgi:hypothetical protein
MQIDIDDTDWANLQYVLINASGAGITLAMTHRLLTKIGMQLQQRGNGNAIEARGPSGSESEYSRAGAPRIEAEVASPDRSDSPERSAGRQARRPT